MDPKYLQTEGTYQLIVSPLPPPGKSESGKRRKTDGKGMDTPLPHLKIGNTILQGQVTPLIGTEIILGLIRSTSLSLLLTCPLGPFLGPPSLGPTLDYVEGNDVES